MRAASDYWRSCVCTRAHRGRRNERRRRAELFPRVHDDCVTSTWRVTDGKRGRRRQSPHDHTLNTTSTLIHAQLMMMMMMMMMMPWCPAAEAGNYTGAYRPNAPFIDTAVAVHAKIFSRLQSVFFLFWQWVLLSSTQSIIHILFPA